MSLDRGVGAFGDLPPVAVPVSQLATLLPAMREMRDTALRAARNASIKDAALRLNALLDTIIAAAESDQDERLQHRGEVWRLVREVRDLEAQHLSLTPEQMIAVVKDVFGPQRPLVDASASQLGLDFSAGMRENEKAPPLDV